MIPLGEYRFDKRNTELLFENQRTELTGKEADIAPFALQGRQYKR